MNLYGFFIGLACVIVLATADRFFREKIKVSDYLIIAFSTLLFARLGFFLNYLSALARDPLEFFRIYEGGLSIFGAFFGLALSAYFNVFRVSS